MHRRYPFMREQIIGIDIADNYITAAQVYANRQGQIRSSRLGWIERDPEASDRDIVSAIRSLWKVNRFATYTVCSCLRNPSLTLKYFSYPRLSPEDLKATLLLEAEQTLQLPQDQVVIDWHINPANGDHGNSQSGIHGTLIAVPRESVERHVRLLHRASLYPVILDVGCMAACNLFLTMRGLENRDDVVGVVHLSAHTADIAILSWGSSVYPRTFFARQGPWEKAIDYLVENVIDELRYYQFKLRKPPVQRLILTGRIPDSPPDGPALPTGTSTERLRATPCLNDIRKATGLPVEVWNPLESVTLDGPFARHAKEHAHLGPLMSVSMGLALRGV